MRPFAIGLLAAVALCGCQPTGDIASNSQTNDGASNSPASAPAKWIDAPERSMVILQQHDGPLGDSMMRCWRVEKGYDCLKVSQFGNGSAGFERFDSAALPTWDRGDSDGYACNYVIDSEMITEAIGHAGPPLVSNRRMLPTDEPAWSHAYVKRFMDDNKIAEADRYFPCEKVVAILKNGSIQSFMATAIRHADLGE